MEFQTGLEFLPAAGQLKILPAVIDRVGQRHSTHRGEITGQIGGKQSPAPLLQLQAQIRTGHPRPGGHLEIPPLPAPVVVAHVHGQLHRTPLLLGCSGGVQRP